MRFSLRDDALHVFGLGQQVLADGFGRWQVILINVYWRLLAVKTWFSPKIKIVTASFSAILRVPFARLAWGKTALKFRVRVDAKATTTSNINPVFRGMLR